MKKIFCTYFPFEVDIEKAGLGSDDSSNSLLGPISGIASTDIKDRDDEIIVQEGLDWSLFKDADGNLSPIPLTYEHPFSVQNIVGEATSIEIVDLNGRKATKIKGNIFLNGLGKELYEKAVLFKKSGSKLRLGFSIEGNVLPGGRDGNRITRARVRSIAISAHPRNPESWLEPLAASVAAMLKAESVGYPAQGESAQGTGGLEKIVPQVHTKKVDTALYTVSAIEASALAVAKQFPELSWARCCELAKEIQALLSGSKGSK